MEAANYLCGMLQNWLKPLSASSIELFEQLPAYALGKQVLFFKDELPALKKIKVAVIGTHTKEAELIRRALYALSGPFPAGSIADLGNLRKADSAQLIPVLYELITGGVLPLILSADPVLCKAQFYAYQEAKAVVNWAIIDEQLRWDEILGSVVEPRHPALFHLSLIGTQSHLVPDAQQLQLEKANFESLRLGRSRTALEEAEPTLRDADLLSFQLAALKMSDMPGVLRASPSGYFIEEACQLARYAGVSDKLSSFGIYGYAPDRDHDAQSAQGAAQIAWYFLDGVFHRQGDYPASLKGMTEYVVDFPSLNYQLTFWKSVRTARWWLQVPVDIKRKHQRHRLIPCSYQDYQSACREELPDRLLAAFKRF